MRRASLVWKIYIPYLLLVFCAVLALSLYSLHSVKTYYLSRTQADLESRVRLLETVLAGYLSKGVPLEADALCKSLGKASGTRFTLMSPSGLVLGDTEADPLQMENHADRPEFKAALSGGLGASVRPSPTLGVRMMYVAIPVRTAGAVSGIARAAVPVEDIDRILSRMYAAVMASAAVVVLLAALVGLAVSRSIARPLSDLKSGAQRFARGELGYKLLPPDSEEFAGLAEALNTMASELDEKIRAINRHKADQQAILSSMAEGVLAVDNSEKVMMINRAAADFLSSGQTEARGQSLQEVVRSADIEKLVSQVLSSGAPADAEVRLRGPAERIFEVHATPLRDAVAHQIGALLVLGEVTTLRRLETMRRDFVANVSHELKTPVTSIKGFVETLREGAAAEPEKAERFLRIIADQTDRLGALIDDLLLLSRIEKESERSEIALEEARLFDVLASAASQCQSKAAARKIDIVVECDTAISLRCNPLLLEQAVANLIDNSIKYSPEGSAVRVQASRTPHGIALSVFDNGCGIPSEHLPRVFERFYRVDTARSRALGGTGLGLSIVKHIAQAHRGGVSVQSEIGKGSCFTIHLPA